MPLKAQNDYFLEIWGSHGPSGLPGYAYDTDYKKLKGTLCRTQASEVSGY